MSKQIFIINGSGGVGKDTFCEKCGLYTDVKVVSSIDLVKHFATEMDCNNIIKAQMGAPIDYAYGPRFSGKYNGYTYDEGLNIQKMLASAGYNVGVLDGKVGKKTLDALKKWKYNSSFQIW